MQMIMDLQEVRSGAARRAFHRVARRQYAGDAQWPAPMEGVVERLFVPGANRHLAPGDAARWVLYGAKGLPVGRVAACVNPRKAYGYPQPTGGVGLFECPDDPAAAGLLLDAARAWLSARGMAAMDGPVTPGENDHFWGLWVWGSGVPAFGMNYNPRYYAALWEGYGFSTYCRQWSYALDLTRPLPGRIAAIGARALGRAGVEIRYPARGTLRAFAGHFRTIYNDAWQFHDNFTPIDEGHVEAFLRDMVHLLTPALMPFAFVGGEPVACTLCVPDLGQVLGPLRGRFGGWEKLMFALRAQGQLAHYRRGGQLWRARGLVAGVRPAFRRLGLEAAMICDAFPRVRALGYREVEISWIGDFNPGMMASMAAVAGPPVREHRLYRYLFDRSLPPQYAPSIAPPKMPSTQMPASGPSQSPVRT